MIHIKSYRERQNPTIADIEELMDFIDSEYWKRSKKFTSMFKRVKNKAWEEADYILMISDILLTKYDELRAAEAEKEERNEAD